jgi:TP901 family phage tail tape measure protein
MAIGLNAGRILFELAIVGRRNVEDEMRRAESAIGRYAAAVQGFAMDMTLRFSLMSGVITGFAAKTAVDFDKAMREVQRTTGLSRQEVDSLGTSLLGLSRNLPTAKAAEGLAQIAKVAGYLGFTSRDEIEAFTIGVNKLTTVFSALDPEQTATKMAQIARAFGIPIQQVEWMGSVISELDNRTTATAAELITFSQAVAGAGQNAGFTFPNIVAIAAAIKDVGLRTEVAATAVNQLFSRLATQPESFAKIVGIQTKEFRRMIEENAVGALVTWLEALKALSGESAVDAIRELQLRGVRATNVITLLAERVDVLRNALRIADQEAANSTSLNRQWDVVNTSVAASINRVVNSAIALGIQVGQNMFPMLERLLGVMTKFIQAFDSLPGFVKNFAASIGVILTLAGPLSLLFANSAKLAFDMATAIGAAFSSIRLITAVGLLPGETAIGAFLSLLGPGKVVMLAFAAVAIGASAAMAFFGSKSDDAARQVRALNDELRSQLQSRLRDNQAVVQVAESIGQIEKSSRGTGASQKELNGQVSHFKDLLPGVIRDSDSLSESIAKIKQEALRATEAIRLDRLELEKLSDVERGLQLIESERALVGLNEQFEKLAKSIDFGGWETVREQFSNLARIIDMPTDELRQRQKDLKEFGIGFLELGEQGRIGAKEIGEGFLSLSSLLVKVASMRDQIEKLKAGLRPPEPKPGGVPAVTPFDIEAEERIAEALREQLKYAQSLLDNAQERTREAVKEKAITTPEAQKAFLQSVTVSQEEATDKFRAGSSVLEIYNRAVAELVRQLDRLRAHSTETSNVYQLLGERTQILTKQSKELSGSFGDRGRMAVPFDAQLSTLVQIVQLQREQYRNDLRDAEMAGQKERFLEENQGRLQKINALRDETVGLIEAEIERLTGVRGLTQDAERQVAVIAEHFKDRGFVEQLSQLLSLLRVLERGERATKVNTVFAEYQKQLEEMGVTARNAYRTVLEGWRQLNQRIVQMAWEGRLQLKDVWQAIAQDFLSMFLDEIFKRTIGKLFGGILATLFGGAGAISEFGPGGLAGDFLVRGNGAVMAFDPTDTVIGFKSLTGLLSQILPVMVGPEFGPVPAYNVNVAPPAVTVNNRPPEVSLYLREQIPGTKFFREEEPRYQVWRKTRKLGS